MKTFSERHIHRSELLQLIILQYLYSRPESTGLVFQGGTAIRWCHGSGRYSEDLDFVTHMERSTLERLIRGIEAALTREAIAHFGPGRLAITPQGQREEGMVWHVTFDPQNMRGKIMVKVECEQLREGRMLRTEPRVLGMQAAVVYLVSRGALRIPRPNSVMVVETLEEILSDKIRALLERPYLKGRDIYDVWHLREGLKVSIDREIVERKFSCYSAPFTLRRSIDWFESADIHLKEAIEKDLGRFLSPEVMTACRDGAYRPFLDTLKMIFRELKEIGVVIPS